MNKILLLGNSGHAKSVVDTIEHCNEFEIAGFVANDSNMSYKEYKVIGTDNELESLYKKGIHYAHIAIGFMGEGNLRQRLYDKLKNIGYKLPVLIDDSAIVAKDAIIKEGAFVGKKCIINSNSLIKKCAIINSGSIIEHDTMVGEFSHVAVGAIICGNVILGNGVFIGANATIVQNIKITDNAFIKAGKVISDNMNTVR